MAENEGLHLQLTADASSYISTINNAKNKLTELAAETKILKQGEKDIQKALAESKKKYGENSVQVDKLTADLADNAREQEKLKQEIKEVNATLDKATKEYKEYGNSAKQSFESVSQQSQKTAETLKSGFNMVKGLIVGYAGKKLYEVLIGTNADYEQSLTSFEVLLQSADKADAMMQKLEKMGASTPFELSDLTAATEQLLAYGTAEADVETRLQQLGDLSKGNAERFESMTNAYGRMLAKGKVSLEELNMFTEAGVPILEELQNQYNVTGEEMFKMISDGKVGVEEINSAMESMTGQGGRFYGMMEKQSKTLDGMLSTMSDNVNMFGRLVGEETFEILKTELEDLLATINEMSESGELQAIAHDLGQGIATAVTFIIDLIKWLYEMRGVLIVGTSAVLGYKTALIGLSIFNSISSWVRGWNTVIKTSNSLTQAATLLKNIHKAAVLNDATAIKACSAAGLTDVTVKGGQIVATKAATGATVSFNAALAANPIGAVITLVVGLTTAILSLIGVIKSSTEATSEATTANVELEDSYTTAIKSIEERKNAELAEITVTENLINKLLKLGDEYEACGKDTAEAKVKEEEFRAVAEQVAEVIPNITDCLYDETGAINVQSEAVKKLKDNYVELAKAKAFATAIEEEMTETVKKIRDFEKGITLPDFTPGAIGYNMLDYSEKANAALSLYKESPDLYNAIMGAKTDFLKNRSSDLLNGSTNVELATDYSISAKISELDGMYKQLDNLSSEYAGYLATIDELSGKFESNSPSGGGTSSGKSPAELAKEAYEARRKADDDYIRERELYNNWGDENLYGDLGKESKFDALQRIMTYTDDALNAGILSWDEYRKEIEGLSEEYYSDLKDMVEDEKKRVKEQLEDEYKEKKQFMEDEYKEKKQLMEDELTFRKQLYDKEIEYLDKLKEKREDEKEDEDYAERMARLQAKLEYEMDDDNRLALQKEIAELQEEIDDTEFDREIERKKSVLDNRKISSEEKTQKGIDDLTAYHENEIDDLASYYENAMSDINIAEMVYKNLDFDKFKEIGELMGKNLVAGIYGILDPGISAINKLVTLGSNVQSPTNNTVTTTDNSISVTQYNNGVSNVPTAAETKKAVDDYMFLNGRLG